MIRVATYLFCTRIFTRLAHFTNALYTGFWLGVIDSHRIDKLNDTYYKSTYCATPEHNESGLMCWEREAIVRYFGDCQSVIVAASGGGREVIALADMSIQCEAFDCCQELIEFSQRLFDTRGLAVRTFCAAPNCVPEKIECSDGAIIGWGGYMHIHSRQARVDFLRQLHQKIRVGGPLLLSFFTRSEPSRFFSIVFHVASIIRTIRLSKESLERGDVINMTFDHHFIRAEIDRELSEAGYTLVHFDAHPYGHAVATRN